MTLPAPRPLPVSIPIVALADLALLTVLIYLAGATIDTDRTPIVLPAVEARAEAGPGAASVVLARRLLPSGEEVLTYRFSDGSGATADLAGPATLFLEASRVADRDPAKVFVIRADEAIRYATVDALLETLREAGVRRIVLQTRPPGRAGEGAP